MSGITPRNVNEEHAQSLTWGERIALGATRQFGTLWMTMLFVIYGALGALFVQQQPTLLYWSNWVQLWSLPLILVGTNLLGRHAEIRAEVDHEKLLRLEKAQEANLNVLMAMLTEIRNELEQLTHEERWPL